MAVLIAASPPTHIFRMRSVAARSDPVEAQSRKRELHPSAECNSCGVGGQAGAVEGGPKHQLARARGPDGVKPRRVV